MIWIEVEVLQGKPVSYLEDLDKRMRNTDPKYDQVRAVDSFIAELARIRRANGLTQAQVAKAAGIRQSHISRIENYESDMVSFATIMRYANAIGMTVTLTHQTGEDPRVSASIRRTDAQVAKAADIA